MDKAPVAIVETNAYLRRAERLMTEEERTACSELIAYDPAYGEIMQGPAVFASCGSRWPVAAREVEPE